MTTNSAAAGIAPPPSRRVWAAVAALSLGAFVLVATEFVPVGIIPAISDELTVSIGTAGLTILVPGLVAAISAPLVVIGSGRLRRDRLVLLLGLLLLLANIISSLAPTFETLLTGRVLVGIALGGFWAVVPSLGFRLVAEGSGPRATSVILAGISVGTVVGLPAGQLIGDLLGWRSVFAIAAGVSLIVVLAQVAVLPRIAAGVAMRIVDLRAVFASRSARIGLAFTSPVVLGQFAASTFVTPFFEDEVKLAPVMITLLFLGYGVAGIAGTLLGGVLLTRSRLGTLRGSIALLGVALLLLPVVTGSPVATGALFLVWGLVWGIVPLALQTWMITALPHAPEAASAVLVTTLQFSIAVGALLGGLVVDSLGLRVNFFVAGALAVVAAAVGLRSTLSTVKE